MSEPFIGEIKMFGFNFCPLGWAAADGQLLDISSNTALFSLFGTIYGGDGRTTFGLPDLRGRVPIHFGNGPGLSSYPLGQKGGRETVTLTTDNMPSHNHAATATATGLEICSKAENATVLTYKDTFEDSCAMRYETHPEGRNTCRFDTVEVGAAVHHATNTGLCDKVIGEVMDDTAPINVANTGGGQAVGVIQPYLAVRYCVSTVGLYPSMN